MICTGPEGQRLRSASSVDVGIINELAVARYVVVHAFNSRSAIMVSLYSLNEESADSVLCGQGVWTETEFSSAVHVIAAKLQNPRRLQDAVLRLFLGLCLQLSKI